MCDSSVKRVPLVGEVWRSTNRMANDNRIGKVYANDHDRWVPCSGQEVLA